MPSGTLYPVAIVRTDVSENISPPSSGFVRVMTKCSLRTQSEETVKNSDTVLMELTEVLGIVAKSRMGNGV
jgi:hypothetical protein